jgi:tetratricopeptide (TPR) repeat protein
VTVGSLAVEWWAFDGSPLGFHVTNVLLHAGASLLVAMLLAGLVSRPAALVGALIFAVHPVHVEAVANVVGQAELLAAVAVLLACLLYLKGAGWEGAMRGLRLAGITCLYLLGIGAKESAATLPALLFALELARPAPEPASRRVLRETPLYLSLTAALATYLVLRTAVLGTVAGEVPAPWLRELSSGERVLTAVSVWPEYLRLLVYPLDLAADYSPGVLATRTGVDAAVLLGATVMAGLFVLAWASRRRAPLVALGLAWFAIAILPVSNLLIPAGVILAERTLYLPSVGLAFALAALAQARIVDPSPRRRRTALAFAVVVGILLTVRTVLRNPTWLDSYTVLNTLAIEHPESWLSFKSRALGLAGVGDVEGARSGYAAAVELAPAHYGLLVEAAEFHGTHGEYARAEQLLDQAVAVSPDLPEAYLLRAEYHIVQGRGREGHRVALTGLARAGADPRLYAAVSEAYVAKGELEGAARARMTAALLAEEPDAHWARLADLYDAMNRPVDARAARDRSARGG